jgi:ATP-binding cassette subfamily F protein uup
MKNRLLLSKILANPKSGLILDEPTNDLDTDTLDLVESILSQYNGTLIIVSHNRDFLDKLVNKILYFKGNGEIIVFNGGYHDFLERKEDLLLEQNFLTNKLDKQNSTKSKKTQERKKLTFKLQFELDNIPVKIDNLKKDLQILEEIISDTTLYDKNNELFLQTSQKIGLLQFELQDKEARWLELMEMEGLDELS